MADLRLSQLESQVEALHRKAQELNKAGLTENATAAYKEMAALDDELLHLVMSSPVTAHPEVQQQQARLYPDYHKLHRPGRSVAAVCGTASAPVGRKPLPASQATRALGAVLGCVLGDAAAMGVHWVYDLTSLHQLERDALAAGRGGLEFMDPPRTPFYSYPSGRASPYGEQTLVLMKHLAQEGGLDCRAYAAVLAGTFGPRFDGYRDASTKAFLRRWASGQLPPLTGAPADRQANAFTRLPPLVALFAGDKSLGLVVEAAIRVTQNDDVAVAYGLAAAAILEQLILGSCCSVTAAVERAVRALRARARCGGGGAGLSATSGSHDAHASSAGAAGAQQAQQAQRYGEGRGNAAGGRCEAGQAAGAAGVELEGGDELGGVDAVRRVSAELAAEVAEALERAQALARLPAPAAHAVLGRNCHLPTSLLTPLHILMHMEGWEGIQGGIPEDSFEFPASAHPITSPPALGRPGQHDQPAQRNAQQTQHGASMLADSAAAFCLPCSQGAPGEGGKEGARCAWIPPAQQGASSATSAPPPPTTLVPAQHADSAGARSAQGMVAAQGVPAGPHQQQAPGAQLAPSQPSASSVGATGFVRAVRTALREGGCCASRACWVGACLGALGGVEFLPPSWKARIAGWGDIEALALELCEMKGS